MYSADDLVSAPSSRSSTRWSNFLDYLFQEDGPLDVTSNIQQGVNTLRLVQLMDISHCTFILYAGVPAQEEKERWVAAAADSHDWAEFVTRASKDLILSTHRPS